MERMSSMVEQLETKAFRSRDKQNYFTIKMCGDTIPEGESSKRGWILAWSMLLEYDKAGGHR